MSQCEEHYRVLISGRLDGELTENQSAELDAHLADCFECQREMNSLQRLFVGTGDAFGGETPPDEEWDRFLDHVYNRMERRTGWILLILGVTLLSIFGTYQFVVDPWGSALLKTLVAIPVIGFLVLFISVLRQRMESIKTDRYEREVHR